MVKVTVFDTNDFISRVRSVVLSLEVVVEKYLADIMQKEAKSNINDDFKNTLAQFKASVTARDISGNTKTFPAEVYNILLARHAIKYAPQIENIDGTLIKEMQNYIADILGTDETVVTTDGVYKVSTQFAKSGLSTVTDSNERLYTLTWRNDSAKESLYSLLRSLKSWGQNFQNYFFEQLFKSSPEQIFVKWTTALITCKPSDVRALYKTIKKFAKTQKANDDDSAWTDDDYSNWLSKLTNELFPTTINKEIAALQKKYQTLDDLARDTALLKDYKANANMTVDTIKNTITNLNSYKKFIKAYNDLQTAIGQSASNFDSLIPNYIGYEITNVVSGTFNEDNATITCTNGDNEITVKGNNVKVDTGHGNDYIYNYGSNSTIDANTGDDSIRSQASNVSIQGGNGNDNIETWNSSDTVDGGAGDDSIYSHGSDSSIFGSEGNDEILIASSGYVDGGTGVDTIAIQGSYVTAYGGGSFDMLPTKDVFNIGLGVNNVYINDFEFGDVLNLPAGEYTAQIEFGSTAIRNSSGKLIVWLNSFTEQLENLTYNEDDKKTTDGDDSINNDASNIKIDLGAGNDYAHNSGDNVSINGGDGNDTINSNGDNDYVFGNTGNDIIYNSGANTSICCGAGEDTISSDSSNVSILSGEGNDSVRISYPGNNFLCKQIFVDGGADNDIIENNEGTDTTILGGTGIDSIYNRSHDVTIDGGADNDYIRNYTDWDSSNISIHGDNGNDTIISSPYDSYYADYYSKDIILDGGNGEDIIYSSGWNVTMNGGAGNDTILYERQDNPYSDPNSGVFSIDSGGGTDLISIKGGYAGWVTSGGGDDTIYADELFGGFSFNYRLGDGNDIVNFLGNSMSVNILDGDYGIVIAENDVVLTVGEDSIILKDYSDKKIDVKGKSLSGAISLLGSEGNDNFYRVSADSIKASGATYNYDTNIGYINALGGDDYISHTVNGAIILGGTGNDYIVNSGNSANINGEADDDYLSNSGTKTTLNGGTGNDTVSNSGLEAIINGNDGNDSISNDSHGVLIDGGKGNDIIVNNSYDVTVLGDVGNDTINSKCSASINGGSGNDLINLIETRLNSATINVASGNDTIRIDSSSFKRFDTFMRFNVEGFGTGDEIKFSNAITSISGSGDSLLVVVNDSTVTIGGLTFSKWNTKNSIASYYPNGLNGICLSKDSLSICCNASLSSARLELEGISNTEGVSISSNGAYALLDASSFNSAVHVKSNTGNYGFNLNGTLKNSSTFTTTNKDDAIVVYVDNIKINAGAGNDTVTEGGSNTTINSGTGNDSIKIYGSNSSIAGESGDDYFYNYRGEKITINGGKGNDIVYNYYSNNALIAGEAGNDSIFNNNSENISINGGNDNDTINNYNSKVTIDGGTGNDSIENRASTVTINGGSGEDYIVNEPYYAFSSARSDYVTINAGNGNDTIKNYGSNISISGGKGNDSIMLDGINNLVKYEMNDGNDIIKNFSATDTLQISGGKGTYFSTTSGNDIIITVGTGKISLIGAANLDSINIDGYATQLTFDDTFAKKITLKPEVLTADAKNRTNPITITGNSKNNTIIGSKSNDIIQGQKGNDSLVGNTGDDKLYGDDDNDRLLGDKGNDSLWGGTGNDSLWGGDGNDTFIYEAGKDVIADFTAGQDKIQIASGKISKTSLKGSDVLFTIGKGSLTVKNAKGKTISLLDSAGKASSTVVGAQALTNSNKANVTIGADMGFVDSSKRTKAISIKGNALANTISGGTKNDSIFGAAGNDSILGNAGNDKLYGDAGNDILLGGKGNDSLWGGAGNDSLWGDAGKDTFFYTANEGTDRIFDYEAGDMLKILNADGSDGSFKSSKFSGGDLTLTINGGGKIIFDDVAFTTKFNINGSSYNISGSKLVKK